MHFVIQRYFPYAGNAVASDIAFAFGTPIGDAEEIKVKYGCALSELVSKDDTVNVPSVGGRPSRSLQRQTLSEVIEPRYTELMGMVNQTIDLVQERWSWFYHGFLPQQYHDENELTQPTFPHGEQSGYV